MILKALYDYYNRCEDLPKKGLELKEIGYLIVIQKDGTFVRIESRMKDKKTAAQFMVPQQVTRARNILPNCLWDNIGYVLGGEGYAAKNKAFIARIKELKEAMPHNVYLNAISAFYEKYNGNIEETLSSDLLWTELLNANKNLSFLIKGQAQIAAADKDITDYLAKENVTTDNLPICLVSGCHGTTARIHHKTPYSKNLNSTSLVSFQKKSGYDSYGKEQGSNAPVSEEAEFAYTTSLNHLLEFDSHNKFVLGNRTFVFWASNNDETSQKAEEALFEIFTSDKNNTPNAGIKQVRDVFKSIYSGKLKTTCDDRFYILGITAANKARIAVVYWSETSLKDFAGMIERHFADMEIADTRNVKNPYMGLHSMLSNVTLGGKESDATPNLPEAIAKSIFQGLPYPFTLFSSCIRRIRAEQGDVRIGRAAIIKAYLNRLPNDNNNQKINVMLDKENINQGYLCGRLFAVLDKVQEEANNIHTVRERYMNAASATPSAVFATILNLSTHHAEKLSEERRIKIERLKQEIIDKISADGFPAHLDLQDQGRFFVGYYHQRKDF